MRSARLHVEVPLPYLLHSLQNMQSLWFEWKLGPWRFKIKVLYFIYLTVICIWIIDGWMPKHCRSRIKGIWLLSCKILFFSSLTHFLTSCHWPFVCSTWFLCVIDLLPDCGLSKLFLIARLVFLNQHGRNKVGGRGCAVFRRSPLRGAGSLMGTWTGGGGGLGGWVEAGAACGDNPKNLLVWVLWRWNL